MIEVANDVRDGLHNVRHYYAEIGGGVADDAARIQAVIASAGVNGRVRVPPGTYLISSAGLTPLSGQTIDLTGATLKFPANTTLTGMFDADGASGVTIIGGTLDGNVANQTTWSEQRHCIRVRDSSRVAIRGMRFQNIIGDGVYISHGAGAVAPFTGSSDVTVEGCTFTGSNLNRNGVSVICATDVRIINNRFYRMSKAGMPGAIDLEPNSNDDFIRDIKIVGNTVDNTGSAVVPNGGIAGGNHAVTAAMDGILVAHNTVRGSFFWGMRFRCNSSVTERGLVLARNHIRDVSPATGVNYGIRLDDCTASLLFNEIDTVNGEGIAQIRSDVFAVGNTVRNVTNSDTPGNGFGVSILDPTDVAVYRDNFIAGCDEGIHVRGSNNQYVDNTIRSCAKGIWFASGTGNRISGNAISGATTAVGGATTGNTIRDNVGYATEASGAASVADGGTISHGLAATPTRVTVTASVAGEFASVTAVGASTVTVALRKHDGTAGTTQTVYWRAEV